MLAATDSGTSTIFIPLLDEGTTVLRPTQGLLVCEGLFAVQSTPDYDPNDEHWEFAPGSVVRCVTEEYAGESILVARELVTRSMTFEQSLKDGSKS